MPLPRPYSPVNVWLIDDEPLTLVDTGAAIPGCYQQLSTAFEELGFELSDLELILITHEHPDHRGLAGELVRRTGAQLAGLAQLAPRMSDVEAAAKVESQFYADVLSRNGVPADVLTQASRLERWSWMGESVQLGRPLMDGDQIELANRTLEVQHRPGHSGSDTYFADLSTGAVFVGDQLMDHKVAGPIIGCRPELIAPGRTPISPEKRLRALPNFLAELSRLRDLPPALLLPGHGYPISNVTDVANSRIRQHQRRKPRLLSALEPGDSAYDIAVKVWGSAANAQVFGCISEALGNLDLLQAENFLNCETVAGIDRWSPA